MSEWASLSSRPPAARRPITTSADEPPTESPPAVSNQPNSVMLGPRDRVIGQIYIEGDLRVGGVVEGEVEATGDVEIDDLAKVKASVAGRDVSIRGQVNGAIVARKRLVVARSGSLVGDVRVQRLVIQDGASFSGKASMGAAAEAPAAVAPPPKPVAQEPDIPLMVEAPARIAAAPVVVAPVVATPIAPSRAAQVRPRANDRKDRKAKAMPPKVKPKPKRR